MPISFYRYLAVFVFLCSGAFLTYERYLIGGIIFFIGIVVAQGYMCRFCGKSFDIRLGKRRLQHCPRCGERIDW